MTRCCDIEIDDYAGKRMHHCSGCGFVCEECWDVKFKHTEGGEEFIISHRNPDLACVSDGIQLCRVCNENPCGHGHVCKGCEEDE